MVNNCICLLSSICGTLHSVDQVWQQALHVLSNKADWLICGLKTKLATPLQYLNIKLTDISVTDPEKYPHMVSFIYFFFIYYFFYCQKDNTFMLSQCNSVAILLSDTSACSFLSVVSEKLLYPWLSGAVCSASCRRGGHTTAARCCTQRGHATETINALSSNSFSLLECLQTLCVFVFLIFLCKVCNLEVFLSQV